VFVHSGMGFTTNAASSAFFTLTGFHWRARHHRIIMLISLLVLSLRGRIPQERAEDRWRSSACTGTSST